MDFQHNDKNQSHIVQIMTTEHYTLQTGRSLVVSDTNGRASLFLSTVSSTLIALAFVGNISHLGGAFFVFALVLFPSLLFLGLATFDTVLQSAIEEKISVRGINRIRHLYVEMAPQIQPYFLLPTHDDETHTFQRASWWQNFLTLAGIIAVINSILAGVFVGLLMYQLFALSLLLCVMGGLGMFLLSLIVLHRYQFTQWRGTINQLPVLFPPKS
ncbi:MAG: hypothetical protein J2P36_07155 [Ktedonobacteraceae bacterium]|nr:hypothetical protein [Ktedonobacteraceae bacterium]